MNQEKKTIKNFNCARDNLKQWLMHGLMFDSIINP